MLVSADNRALDALDIPIELTGSLSLRLHGVKQPLKDPGFPPAVDAARHRPPGAVALRHVVPRRARAEHPQHPVQETAVVSSRASRLGLVRGKEWLKPLPLYGGRVSSMHSTQEDSEGG